MTLSANTTCLRALIIISFTAVLACGSQPEASSEASLPDSQVEPLTSQQALEAEAHVDPEQLGYAMAKIRCTWIDRAFTDRKTCEREVGLEMGQVYAAGSCITSGGTLDAASVVRCEAGFRRAKLFWDRNALLMFAAQMALTVKVDCSSERLCGFEVEDLVDTEIEEEEADVSR